MVPVERLRRVRLISGFLVAVACTQPAFAQSAGDASTPYPASLTDTLVGIAKSEYESGKLLYADGDYAGAALKFERAYAESRDPRLLWNLAAAEKNQRHYARVLDLIERYIVESGPRISAEERTEAQAVMNTVQAFVGTVAVSVNVGEASIFVDDAEVARSPLRTPLRLDMGPHKVRVTKAGFREASTAVMVQGGAVSSLDVKLEAELHQGKLRVVASPGAAISIDGKVVGAGEWGGTLASGVHGVTVTLDGKRPYQADVAVKDAQDQVLRVVLDPAHDATPVASSGVPTWVWIAGGSVLAAGLGVGAYFVFRPEDEVPVQGSLDTVHLSFTRARF